MKINKIHPTKTELQEVFCKIEANAIGVACVELEFFEFGWSTLIAKESEWKACHVNLQMQDNRRKEIATDLVIDPLVYVVTVTFRPVLTTGRKIPDLPTFLNPGRFKSLDSWTDKQRSIKKIEHDQKFEEFIIAQYVDKTLVMIFKEVFNELL